MVARTMTRNERQPPKLESPSPFLLQAQPTTASLLVNCNARRLRSHSLPPSLLVRIVTRLASSSDLHLQHQTRLRPPSTLPDTFLPRATTKLLSLSQSTCKSSTSPSRQSSSPHFRMEIWGLELNPKYLLVPALR